MEFQPSSHRYMRPPPPPQPPPPTEHHHQLPLPPRPPISAAPGTFYPCQQFQYQHSASPPQPLQHTQPQPFQHWVPPPQPHHLLDHQPYPTPPHASYTTHHPPPNNHYGPPASLPPRSHMPPAAPHSYPQVHQDLNNVNWGHHQGWDYPAAHNSEEVWAAKAKAWAAAQAASDTQHPQPQFTPGRPEEQNHYYDQYPSSAPPQMVSVVHPQEPVSINSGQFSYVSGQHFDNSAADGTWTGDSNAFPHQQRSSPSLLVHQQEVPSSYSSVAGNEDNGHQNENFLKSFPLPVSSTIQQHPPPQPPAVSRPVLTEQSQYAFGAQSVELAPDPSDRPLEFVPRVGPDHSSHAQTSYTPDLGGHLRALDHVSALPPTQTWTSSVAPGVDLSVPLPAPVSGHSGHLIGRMPGPSFQQPISLGASFGVGAGAAVHPTAFPLEAYGISSVPERPRKAPVPNWLREEIIKSKAAIANSAPEFSKVETSMEDSGVDKNPGRDDHADNRSIDSSRSTEEEDDEDDVVAARTAAMNQEIKRVLTEVLLKVTDELFDEVARKVLNEEDINIEVDHINLESNHKVASTVSVSTPMASAKILVSQKTNRTDTKNESENSSGSPGDVLGLASYASDEDEDNQIQSSNVLNTNEKVPYQQSTWKENPEGTHVTANGDIQSERKDCANTENDVGRKSLNGVIIHHSDAGITKDETIGDDKKELDRVATVQKHIVQEKVVKSELLVDSSSTYKIIIGDSLVTAARNNQEKSDRHETRKSSSDKDQTYLKREESHSRQEEKRARSERSEVQNGSKERTKDSNKSEEKDKVSVSRKRSPHFGVKDGKKDVDRDRRTRGKEVDRKRERANDDEGERARHKPSDSSRHRRRRSSSRGSRGRHGKDLVATSDAEESHGESSEDSRRRQHSRNRNLSPSPVGSRRRRVSRSPHSKHSQRRHSPYSSLETTRRRRSRSRSRSPAYWK